MLSQQGEREREREREHRRRVPYLASTETDLAAKSVADRTPVKDGPVEGGRSPREKSTTERVGHDW
jgi:hypothetical protein